MNDSWPVLDCRGNAYNRTLAVASGALLGLVLLVWALAGYVVSVPRLAFPGTTGNVANMGIVIVSGALELTTVI
jgi:hypothetical protein